jgi:hypothetical protein
MLVWKKLYLKLLPRLLGIYNTGDLSHLVVVLPIFARSWTKNFSKADLPVYIAEDPFTCGGSRNRYGRLYLKLLQKFKSILIK